MAAVFANLPGFGAARGFEALTGLHLPIALLLAVGIAHAGGRWGEVGGRMDFIRFLGELFIQYVLIALGGGVLCAFMALTFSPDFSRLRNFLSEKNPPALPRPVGASRAGRLCREPAPMDRG